MALETPPFQPIRKDGRIFVSFLDAGSGIIPVGELEGRIGADDNCARGIIKSIYSVEMPALLSSNPPNG